MKKVLTIIAAILTIIVILLYSQAFAWEQPSYTFPPSNDTTHVDILHQQYRGMVFWTPLSGEVRHYAQIPGLGLNNFTSIIDFSPTRQTKFFLSYETNDREPGRYGYVRRMSAFASDWLRNFDYLDPYYTNDGTAMFWMRSTTDVEDPIFTLRDTPGPLTDSLFLGVGDGGSAYNTDELIWIKGRWNGSASIFAMAYETVNRDELFDGQWHHIAITADGADWKLYLDGRDLPITVGQGSNRGFWGGQIETSGQPGGLDEFYFPLLDSNNLLGNLSDLRMYDYDLDIQEIRHAVNYPMAMFRDDFGYGEPSLVGTIISIMID